MAIFTVLPTTGVTNNISQVTVNLVNPFTSALVVTQVTSTVVSHGIPLGKIATAINFSAAGKTNTTSPTLNLDLNFDPPSLFTLTRVLAVEMGLDPTQLDGIVKLGGYLYVPSTNADAPPVKRDIMPRDNVRRANIYTYVSRHFRHCYLIFNFTTEGSTCRISLMLLSRPCVPTLNFNLSSISGSTRRL
jgi:hypothetical protein